MHKMQRWWTKRSAGLLLGGSLALSVVCGMLSCSALNPSFVELFAPEGSIPALPIENPPGHVAILLANNTVFDPALVTYLSSQGVDLGDLTTLRPRVRFTTRVTFVDNSFLDLEFVDGSNIFQNRVDTGNGPMFAGALPPDLTQNTKTNAVVLCDVARVEVLDPVEVFVPVFLKIIMITPATPQNPAQPILAGTMAPQFRPLLVDVLNADGAVVLQRNFGIRDVPPVATGLTCGSVVGMIMSGTLRVTFVSDENGVNNPGYVTTDIQGAATNPGRFQFRMSIR
ncbi:MAG TPA: hypothetical protein VGM03_01040 [Phycisphaerae bacterium]|jgi:hypothetical protein